MPLSGTNARSAGPSDHAPVLAPDICLRLLTHVVAQSLRNMGRDGRADPTAPDRLRDPGLGVDELRALRVDETGLGLDSLARLDLAMEVARYFEMDRTGVDDYLTVRRTIGDWADLAGESLRLSGGDAALVFSTSGSSGPPKHVRHRLETLRAEMRAFQDLPQIAATPPERIVTLVPAHHIYGALYSVILPDLSGIDCVDLAGRPASAVARRLMAGDLIIGTPRDWAALTATGSPMPAHLRGVCSAGPSTPELWRAVQASGIASLTEIFGATETGGLGWRVDGAEPFVLHEHLARSGDGIIDPADGRTLPLQDKLGWCGERRFRPEGRADAAVVVAGVTVSLARVREVLCACPGVADAAVRPGGARLKAFVVPAPGAQNDSLEADLRAHAAQALEAAARPMHFTFGPAVPRNEMGKLSDWASPDLRGN